MSEWLDEVMSREPMTINDDTDMDELTDEMSERLEAVMATYNGCEPTLDGWRKLAMAIALDYHPLFKIVTPVDLKHKKGGAKVGFENVARKSAMKAEMKDGATQRQVAEKLAKKFNVTAKTLENLMKRKAPSPDVMTRTTYVLKAERALEQASIEQSQKRGDC